MDRTSRIRKRRTKRPRAPAPPPKLKKSSSLIKKLKEPIGEKKKKPIIDIEITDEILAKFPFIPKETLKKAKRFINIEEYRLKHKKNIMEDLLEDDTAFDICNQTISGAFIEQTLDAENMRGFVVEYRFDPIGFVFYKIKGNELKVELICVKKKKNTLKGYPLGNIIMELVFNIVRVRGLKKVALESVDVPNTLSFYRKLGFRKFKDMPSGLLLLKKTIK